MRTGRVPASPGARNRASIVVLFLAAISRCGAGPAAAAARVASALGQALALLLDHLGRCAAADEVGVGELLLGRGRSRRRACRSRAPGAGLLGGEIDHAGDAAARRWPRRPRPPATARRGGRSPSSISPMRARRRIASPCRSSRASVGRGAPSWLQGQPAPAGTLSSVRAARMAPIRARPASRARPRHRRRPELRRSSRPGAPRSAARRAGRTAAPTAPR